MSGVPRNRLLTGDVLDHLTRVPDGSVDMVLTSPPYFRLRDYQVSGQLGLEATVQQWVANQRRVAAQVARVLVPSGTYWLNLGDSYSTHPVQGAARKSLLLAPERLALALIRDGWVLRNKIVWHKPNAMPSSVRDRLNTTWEIVYVFTRSPRYFFALDAIRQPHRSQATPREEPAVRARRREAWRGPNGDDASGLVFLHARGLVGHVLGKNPGDVWPLASSNYRGGHHATFPLTLADRCIQGGCPEARCIRCRRPWLRPLVQTLGRTAVRGALQASCDCAAGSEPGLVLDPFIGSGTTAVAAERLGRDWLGIELNPAFAELAERRIAGARAERTRAP